MPQPHVVVRLPSAGTLFGEAVARTPGARVSAVLAWHRLEEGRRVAEHIALVEGLPDVDVARVMLAWRGRYGGVPQALGGPFALRLPVAIDAVQAPAIAALQRAAEGLPLACGLVEGEWASLWAPCGSLQEAERCAAGLRGTFEGFPGAQVGTGVPRPEDAQCWGLLREAAEALAQGEGLALPAA